MVAATATELAPLITRLRTDEAVRPPRRRPLARSGVLEGRRVILAETGVGIAAAAATVGALVERHEPAAVLLTGIGGAYAGSFLPVGAAVPAASELFLDLGVARSAEADPEASRTLPLPTSLASFAPLGPLPTDDGWRDALARASGTVATPFATSDGISGDLDVAAERAARSGAGIESMEGAGVAVACRSSGVPFAEIRGVSNVAGQRDKAAWEIDRAIRAASRALMAALRSGTA